jgi:uncharacterized protein (DUF1015 family)
LADIHPFRGIHYNPSLVKDLTKVLCPPYDIITPLIQQELYQKSDFNFVRIESGRELPTDKDNDNKYTRAAATLAKWLEQGTLQLDDKPAIYLHDQHFVYRDKGYRRRSITCLVKLEDWSQMVIRPHEGTLGKPKGDRLSMLWTLRANTSPILALYEDRNGVISSLVEKESQQAPLLRAEYDNGEAHYLWSLEDNVPIDNIRRCLASQPLYIADGHHRYESALTYQRERRFGASSEPGQEPYDFVMMTLVEFADPGLVILPAHRLVRGISRSVLTGIMSGLETFFTVKQITLDNSGIDKALKLLKAGDENSLRLMIYGLTEDKILLLELRDDANISRMIPSFNSDYNRKLDVSIIDHVILEELMGLTPDTTGALLSYTHDAQEAVKQVLSQEYQLAFLVKPIRPDLIKSTADSGNLMPKKSTYFYPKVPAGLVFYQFSW